MVHQVGFQLVLAVHDNGDILMERTQLSDIFGCLSFHSGLNFFTRDEKLFGLD